MNANKANENKLDIQPDSTSSLNRDKAFAAPKSALDFITTKKPNKLAEYNKLVR